MLFHSALRKDLSRTFGATVVVLVTIVMTIMLIKTLGAASRGSVNPSEVMLVMGLTVLGQLTTILSLSLFIAIVATLSRMHSESEMVIWFSSGRGLGSFVRPTLRFAWPILLGILCLSLFVWPWSNQKILQLQQRYEKRQDIERIAPGQFQESAGGQRVFFVDKDSPDVRSGMNVYVSSMDGRSQTVVTAKQGRVEYRGADKFLVLHQGQQMHRNLDTEDIRITQFEDYEIVVDQRVVPSQQLTASKLIDSQDLILQPVALHLGELSWRLGLGLSAFNLLLLALALASVNPRVGRSYHLALALFAFMAYYNLVNLGQNWIALGKVSFGPYMLGLHGGVLVLALTWLRARHLNFSWRYLLPQRRAAMKGTA